MDDPSLRDLLAKHQEGMAGAGALSLFASLSYAILKGFDLKRASQAAALGVLFATSGYFFWPNTCTGALSSWCLLDSAPGSVLTRS